MRKMPMCPVMQGMYMMPMMQEPMAQMPMMQTMGISDMHHEEDERDEEYFSEMHGDACKRMMPYVMRTVDRAEKKGDMIYDEYPERQMVDRMSEEAYDNMAKDMPDMAEEMEEERQFGGRRFTRDLIRLLLISELLRRRRRRRRRRDHDYWDWDNDYDDFYYYD